MRNCWRLLFGVMLVGGTLLADSPDTDSNVNARYKVETVIVSGSGWSTDVAADQDRKISPSLRKRISTLIGSQLNPSALEDVAKRLSKEFHTSKVSRHVLRGDSPETVKVEFDVGERNERFDVSVSKFLYDSKQGWSGAAFSTTTVKHNAFTFGIVSDNDELPERYAGFNARYENTRVGSDNVHLEFEFDSYHDQWNPNVQALAPGFAAETSGIYRTRQNFEPAAIFMLAEPLTVTVGVSFDRFQIQFPAAHTEASNAVVSTVRYHRQLEGSDTGQDLEAEYALRAATRTLGSDYVYGRHRWELRYKLTHGRHTLEDDFSTGLISGRAPLFDRYVLGNSSTLRGWNRFDLDPLGGNRMVHNSVDYRYGAFEIFYDAGAIWDAGQPATPRHAAGVGLREGAFALAVAFPIRSGRADPIFMMGMNY